MRYLTIVEIPVGANILGLLELFALIGSMFLAASAEFLPASLRWIPMALGFVSVTTFDLNWRLQQQDGNRLRRLVSPFRGGCILFIPVWLVPPSMVITLIVFILMPR
jgi:hypothetical protein